MKNLFFGKGEEIKVSRNATEKQIMLLKKCFPGAKIKKEKNVIKFEIEQIEELKWVENNAERKVVETATEEVYENIRKILNDEEVEGYSVEIDAPLFQSEVWNEHGDGKGYIEIVKEVDENTTIHYLLKTDFKKEMLGYITNSGMKYNIGDELNISGTYYRYIKKEEEPGFILDGKQMYKHILKVLFNRTLDKAKENEDMVEFAKKRIVLPGEKYRHFKNKEYQVIAIANHTERKEQLVIYKALYEPFEIYARPYEMFTSLVDKEKYPAVKQTFRMEKI